MKITQNHYISNKITHHIMAVYWHLSLKASNESDAEKIKAYAKELNNAYKFDLTDEDGYG